MVDGSARPTDRLHLLPTAALVLFWTLLAALLVVKLAGQALDDVFITYRYAQNLAAGEGLVFNPGERVFGTTAPGWALLLGVLARLAPLSVPVLGTLLTGVSLLVVALTLHAEGRRLGRGAETAAGGTLMVSNVYLWMHNGFEVYPALALLLVAAALAAGGAARRGPQIAAGGLAGLAVWLRPEAALGALLLGALLAARALGRRRGLPWAYALTLAATVGCGALAAFAWFGGVLPVSVEAKRIQAAWSAEVWKSGLEFWPEALRWLGLGYTGGAGATAVLAGGGLAGGLILMRSDAPALRLLTLYAAALLIAYPLLGVPFYTWYSIPVVIALGYGLAFAAGAATRRLLPRLRDASRSRPARATAGAVLIGVLLLAALPAWRAADRLVGGFLGFEGMPLYRAYREAGEWLAAHAPPDADIAYVEVGTIAYFSRRPVRDLLGLVSPELLPYVARRDLDGAFLEAPTDYVLDAGRVHGLMAQVVTRDWFAAAYRQVAEIPIPGADDAVVVFRRVPGSTVAPPPPER